MYMAKGDWPKAEKGPDGELYLVVTLREDQLDELAFRIAKILSPRPLFDKPSS
jgi:hypothetical protein